MPSPGPAGTPGGSSPPRRPRDGSPYRPATGTRDPASDGAPLPDAERPAADYADRATDLALDYLKKDGSDDPELLKRLGWTPEELAAFRDRWAAMKRSAREGRPAEAAAVEDSLRSLGLRNSSLESRRTGLDADRFEGDRVDGSIGGPPPAYRDKFRAFQGGAPRTPPAPGR